MAEHDGVGAADPHLSSTERPHASFTAADHDLVGGDRPWLERRPDPLRMGWTAPCSPRTSLPAPPSSGWLRCLHHPPHPSAPGCPRLWPDPVPSGPLVLRTAGFTRRADARRPADASDSGPGQLALVCRSGELAGRPSAADIRVPFPASARVLVELYRSLVFDIESQMPAPSRLRRC